MEILQVKNLSFYYPEPNSLDTNEYCSFPALENISFSIDKGEFITICGSVGSGKSTLLRLLKRELKPRGKTVGCIHYYGTLLEDLDNRSAASEIGFVMQRPEHQIVTDKVWHELAFGLENLGFSTDAIHRRVAEMADYFGISEYFEHDVDTLSGGQKQLLNLAAVMVMQPKLLILDEPTAQLDPIAASNFFATLERLNRDFMLTVIISEHRLEETIPLSDKLIILEKGKIKSYGTPEKAAKALKNDAFGIIEEMPAAVQLYNRFEYSGDCPITIREGRKFIENNFSRNIRALHKIPYQHSRKAILEFCNVYFRYPMQKREQDILRGMNFTVYENEIVCIFGGNGSGKTTALKAAAGINRIYSGKIKIFGKKLRDYKNGELYQSCLAMLPQDVQTLFCKNTIGEELEESGIDVMNPPITFDFTSQLNIHPYDLSGGEQQILGLMKVMSSSPRLLLLDEPTKGIDAHIKNILTKLLRTLKSSGITIVIVTHDPEFAAKTADRCVLFFNGDIAASNEPAVFFEENSFYTTAISRMTRGYYDKIITVDDAETICRANSEMQNDINKKSIP